MSKAQQCNAVRNWWQIEPDRALRSAIRSQRGLAWAEALHRFYGSSFTAHFGKPYAQLNRREKKAIFRAAQECIANGRNKQAALLAFGNDSSRSFRQYRDQLVQSIALINAPQFSRMVENRRQAARDVNKERELFSNRRYAHDDGKLIFSNADIKLYWPYTRRVYSEGPCTYGTAVFAELQEGRDHIVTPGQILAIYNDHVFPAVRRECGAKMPNDINVQIYLADTYLDARGLLSSKQTITGSKLRESPLVTAHFISSHRYSSTADIQPKYKADERIGNARGLALSEYLPHVGSVSALQTFIARGGKTPTQFAQAERQQQAAARFRAANPGWPQELKQQIAYIDAGNFRGLGYEPGNLQLSLPIYYLEAYSRRCAPNTRLPTHEVLAVQSNRTGQITTYSPIGRTRLLQTRDITEEEIVTFATIRADQRPIADAIYRISGPQNWPGARRFGSRTPEAREQDRRVAELGCDSAAMRAYEKKLSAFMAKVEQSWIERGRR